MPDRLAREAERAFHQATLDALPAHIAVLDEDGRILCTNAAWDRFAAANDGAFVGSGADYLAACDAGAVAGEEDARLAATGLRALLTGAQEDFRMEYPCDAPDARRWFEMRARRHAGPTGARVLVQHVDVTDVRLAQEQAHARARLLDEVDAAVIATDMEGTVTEWNRGAETLYGWRRDETVGRPITDLTVGPADVEVAEAIMASVAATGRWEGEFDVRRRDGSTFRAYVRDTVIEDPHGRPCGIIGVSVDISDRVRVEGELRSARDHLAAVTDSMGEGVLTVGVDRRLTYVNPAAERLLGWPAAEIVGRPAGEIMGGVGSHAVSADRHAPAEDEVDVRTHDDEFTRRDGTLMPVTYTATPLATPDGVVGSVVVFNDVTERKAREDRMRRDLEALHWIERINDALERDRFTLFAQPIIDLATGATVQHELLIRMLDDDGGIIAPGSFLPTAEKYGLIKRIDRWVIREAASFAAAGHAVEINLSAESLEDRNLFAFAARELAERGADPALVVFELTETALLRSEAAARAFIESSRRLGCGVALDDFGTGYGGFRYLKQLPVDYLKIDVEFVRELGDDPANQHVVRAVVSLAQGFGQNTVAEGVEDAATLALLREFGVDFAQGYGIGRPAPVRETLLARALAA